MTYNSYKQIMSNKLNQVSFDENQSENRIILGAIMFGALTQLTSSTSSFRGKESVLIDSYIKSYTSIVQSLPKYISYRYITSYIKNNNIQEFFAMKETQAKKIYEYYTDYKILIDYFSPVGFSASMYGCEMSFNNKNLEKLHWNVMVPIFKYYKSKCDIKSSDVNIVNAVYVDGNPGKKVLFNIAGVDDSLIYSDLLTNKLNISEYIYKVELDSNGIIITLK